MNQNCHDEKIIFKAPMYLFFSFCLLLCFASIMLDTVSAEASAKLNITKKVVCSETSIRLRVQKTKKKVKWKSSRPSVAVVNAKGKVVAKKTGTAVITAQIGNQNCTCKIIVKKHTYENATCTQPKTCSRCKKTSGIALGHDYQNATCTLPQTCRRCGDTLGNPLGHLYVDSVIEATKMERGYTQHECSRCNDIYKDQYTYFQPDEKQVYQDMIALKSAYPEGMRWTNMNFYNSPVLGTGYGCAGFSYILSDEAFGKLPYRKHSRFSDLKVGDLLRINNNTHSVVIMEVTSDGVVLAEGNYNSSIHWGRSLSFEEVRKKGTYVLTRYPQ